jgi:predicted GNAT family acetyltransferase
MTEPAPASPTVADHPELMRYEVRTEAGLAGFARYQRRGGHVVFTHTEIDDAFEGQGLGGQLAKGALDDVRSRGLRVVAQCPFIAEWIRRHPDYADLVDPDI